MRGQVFTKRKEERERAGKKNEGNRDLKMVNKWKPVPMKERKKERTTTATVTKLSLLNLGRLQKCEEEEGSWAPYQ